MKEAQNYAEKNSLSELVKHSMSEAKEGRLNLSDSEGKNYGESISAHLNEADNYMQSAQAHFNEAESYQQQANYIKQNGLSINQDLSKQYWDSLVKNKGVEEAQSIVSDPTLNYQEMQSFSKVKRDRIKPPI